MIAIRKHASTTPAYLAMSLPGQRFLNLVRLLGKSCAEDFSSVLRDQNDVLDPDANAFFRNVQARLDRDHHACLERAWNQTVVHFQADRMAQAVNEIFPERLSVQVHPRVL